MSKFGLKDAAELTGSSTSQTSAAWHSARDDAASSGELSERNDNKCSDSETGTALHEFFDAIGLTGDTKD